MCPIECKIRSANIFGEPPVRLGNSVDRIVSLNFLPPKFSAKNAEQINLYYLTQIWL